MNYTDIIHFWFKELEPKNWFQKSDEMDQEIRDRFLETHRKASHGECFLWRREPLGRLAEIIVLDQFSRNIFRDSPESFLTDPLALTLSQEALSQEAGKDFNKDQLAFLLMPFMHSESRRIHQEAVAHFSKPELSGYLDFENRHKKIIDQFGRYPHRNKILGRTSTPEEVQFLEEPGSSF